MSTKPKNRREQIEQKSREFAKRYPKVGPLFDELTFDRIKRGYRRFGAKAVWERIRWESPVGADGKAEWKLGNSFCTHYARAFARKHPEHRKFFTFLKLKSEAAPPIKGRELGPQDYEEEGDE